MQYAVAYLRDNSLGGLSPNTTVTLIEQSHNTYCLATCYNEKNQTSMLKITNLKMK